MKQSRREFLVKSGCGLTMAAMASQIEHFGLMNTLAQKSFDRQAVSPPSDYRALVCIYFFGGNDGNNTVVPNHNDASVSNYAAYAAARAAQGLALPQASLLPISVPRIGGLSYGLHPSFGTITGGINGGLHPLWAPPLVACTEETRRVGCAQSRRETEKPSREGANLSQAGADLTDSIIDYTRDIGSER